MEDWLARFAGTHKVSADDIELTRATAPEVRGPPRNARGEREVIASPADERRGRSNHIFNRDGILWL